jgi:hypothetical protein
VWEFFGAAVPVVELLIAGPVRCPQPKAYVPLGLSQNGNVIVMLEHDKDHISCVDIMTSKGECLYQYAIEGSSDDE